MLDEYKNIVEKATISFESRYGGRGVLVPGNMIITAAHCVSYNLDGSMATGDRFIEEISTFSNIQLKAQPLAVEPVSDIAILSSLDGHIFGKDSDDYEFFCEQTQPVQLCLDEIESNQEFPIYVFTHEFRWIKGSAIITNGLIPYMWCEMEDYIHHGTSGSPILNKMGELVGIVSTIEGEDINHMTKGRQPYLLKALPTWLLYLIRNNIPI